jgi:hypothetical protein
MTLAMSISEFAWPTLLENLAVAHSLCLEIAVRAIEVPGESQAQVLRRAHQLIISPLSLPCVGPPLLWSRFLRLRPVAEALMAETVRRLGEGSATALVPFLISPEAIDNDFAGFHRAIRPRGARLWDDYQRQRVSEGVYEMRHGLGAIYGARVPRNGYPTDPDISARRDAGLADLPANGWDWPVFYRNKIIRTLETFGPVEQAGRLKEAGRQALRRDWEAEAAASRQPAGGFRDIDELMDQGVDQGAEALFLDPTGAPLEVITPEDEVAKKEVDQRKLEFMRRHYGAKAAAVTRALLQDASISDAAKAGGVTDRHARRIRTKLAELGRKKEI